jgi:transposase
MGTVAFHLAPLVERMSVVMKQSGRLFMDETRAPVLDPGRAEPRPGYLWRPARRSRHGGADPPIVVHHAPGRSGKHAEHFLTASTASFRSMDTGYHRACAPEAAHARWPHAGPTPARDHCRDSEG